MRAEWLVSGAVVCLAVLFTGVPRASAGPDETTKQARALYDNGVTDYNLGHYEEALVSFEQAYRIRHDPVFLFNIGQCQRQLHKYEDAERSYRAYLRETTDLPQTTRDQVQKLIADMNKAVEDARSKQPPTATQPPTEPQRIQQRPTAMPAPPPPRGVERVTPSDDRGGRKKIIAGLAVAAFGVAAIAAGGGFYAVASSANDQLNHPSNGVYSQSAENGRDLFQSLDIAAFIIGGVAIVTGTTIAVLGWRQRHRVTFAPMASGSRVAAFNLCF